MSKQEVRVVFETWESAENWKGSLETIFDSIRILVFIWDTLEYRSFNLNLQKEFIWKPCVGNGQKERLPGLLGRRCVDRVGMSEEGS